MQNAVCFHAAPRTSYGRIKKATYYSEPCPATGSSRHILKYQIKPLIRNCSINKPNSTFRSHHANSVIIGRRYRHERIRHRRKHGDLSSQLVQPSKHPHLSLPLHPAQPCHHRPLGNSPQTADRRRRHSYMRRLCRPHEAISHDAGSVFGGESYYRQA